MNCSIREPSPPNWMRRVLLAAGLYNLLWGAAVIAFPSGIFQFAGMELPRYPQIWQCVGMIVGVYGIGYLIAATDPLRHWPITFVALLGKIFGPIGFANALWTGSLPLAFGATIITNDLIWWVPFSAILYQAFKRHADSSTTTTADLARALTNVDSHRGSTLSALSWKNPTLVVFLRHTGCTFCRETLSDLKAQRQTLESRGITLALIHMSDPLEASRTMSRYGLDSVHRFSDPQCELYRAFGLRRGSFQQLFGMKVWFRGIAAGIFGGHGVGRIVGDGFRMPGAFLLNRGKIVSQFQAQSVSDRPDYLAIAGLSDVGLEKPSLSLIGLSHDLAAKL
ncbi:MAG: redoxin domain-containing protein [Planctomycetaceae bacterium]|nr:redoxin domain-containing protein [Planctomycetales bacterium]MCB9920616.1 redoxin domain-containing protein [Planctomycetaceae bacterium]